MLKLLFDLTVLVVIVILPIMYIARAVGAQNTGVWSIVAIIVLQSALSRIIYALSMPAILTSLAALLGSAFLCQIVLDTSFKKGIIICLASAVVIIICYGLVMAIVGDPFQVAAK